MDAPRDRTPRWGTPLVVTLAWALLDRHVPMVDPVRDWLSIAVVALAGGALVGHGIRTTRAAGGRPGGPGWLVIGLGVMLWIAGDVAALADGHAGVATFPSWADVVHLVGTNVMVAGVFVLARLVTGRLDRWTFIDVLIATAAVGSVLWILTVAPSAFDGSMTQEQRWVSALCAFADVMLVAAAIRVALGARRRRHATVLLTLGLAALATADTVHLVGKLTGHALGGSLLGYVSPLAVAAMAAAVMHPSALHLRPRLGREPRMGHLRLVLLTVASATPLVTLAATMAPEPTRRMAVLALLGAIALVLLALRTWSLIDVAGQLAALRGEQRLSMIIDNASDAIVLVDSDGTLAFVSPSVARSWSLEPDGLLGLPADQLVVESDRDRFVRWVEGVAASGASDVTDLRWRDGVGGERVVHATATLVQSDELAGVLVTASDITDRVELERELRQQAAVDPLLGIPNRSTFQRSLEMAGRGDEHHHGSAAVFLDIDDFKDVNDALGHHAGDELLREVARRLAGATRAHDVVARLGGDEFGVLLTGTTDPDEVDLVTRRIARAVSEPVTMNGHEVRTSVSMGVARFEVGDDPTEILRRADLAMYAAKAAGKDTVRPFHEGLAVEAARQLHLRTRLRTALRADELYLLHQPIVDLATGATAGSEALLRWDLDGETVSPLEFVPIAESTGAIVEIGAWVLRRACAEAVAAHGDAPDGPYVSVNVSAVQLDEDLAEHVRAALDGSGLPPHRLLLELTESVMAREAPAQRFLALRDLGVRLAIDDFGTGWCSLSYLRRFPVDVIKIDRTFIEEAMDGRDLYRGIVQLVDSTGTSCLAEGIESSGQADALGGLGVAHAQGWLWGRPAPLTAATGAAGAAPGAAGAAPVPVPVTAR